MSVPRLAPPNRRAVLRGLAGMAAAGLAPPLAAGGQGADPLTLWGIPATPSAVFARAVASGAMQAAAPGARFDVWKSTDQMRAGIASGRFRLFATSSYAAANFFNRGAGTRMVNVVSWGVLYVMARDETITGIEDLAGRKVLLSNKNEAPDLLFRMVLGWAGLDPARDVTLDYVGSPAEAVPLFLAGRADVAVMHEPAATAALMRAATAGVPLFRALDVTELYGHYTGRGPRIPQVGLAASAELVETAPAVIAAAHAACVEAGAWVRAHPQAAGAAAGPALGLPADIVARSLPFVHLDVTSAREARADIEHYFQNLMALAPGIVAGRLPEADFYWG
ncbi:ABC transporter substrate-binding protein [Rhodovulum adriaticum]|uniref:NitT/TauT family transport system substrate-binding protein n=1 Tax=Rhodovulum adriaticum TaxID=35804 RepID=A0A4R2NJ27_RHOAD|nr:PhnD/SsuA/transferrin family substrate-binding protein [Rhodovulum adriaticum]MBK1635878.1 sulfate ABC transporter substrate-binding protein [Rhodovulum adriaticum]TCP21420.1 NitT/TauT family transport system substrate-binding protein [Rhodovulum adriaticum]